jgi:hypothetical protein
MELSQSQVPSRRVSVREVQKAVSAIQSIKFIYDVIYMIIQRLLLTRAPCSFNEIFFCSIFKRNQLHIVVDAKHCLVRLISLLKCVDKHHLENGYYCTK